LTIAEAGRTPCEAHNEEFLIPTPNQLTPFITRRSQISSHMIL